MGRTNNYWSIKKMREGRIKVQVSLCFHAHPAPYALLDAFVRDKVGRTVALCRCRTGGKPYVRFLTLFDDIIGRMTRKQRDSSAKDF